MRYRKGDWIVLHDPWGCVDSPAVLVISNEYPILRIAEDSRPIHASAVRAARPEEIAKARDES